MYKRQAKGRCCPHQTGAQGRCCPGQAGVQDQCRPRRAGSDRPSLSRHWDLRKMCIRDRHSYAGLKQVPDRMPDKPVPPANSPSLASRLTQSRFQTADCTAPLPDGRTEASLQKQIDIPHDKTYNYCTCNNCIRISGEWTMLRRIFSYMKQYKGYAVIALYLIHI